MEAVELALPGVFLITPRKFGDARGFFSETFNQKAFEAIAPGVNFVQDNHSLSRDAGTLRGLHFQHPPYDQGKLVRVIAGSVLDVVVDIRRGSPTFGQHIAVELSAENWQQLWIPAGFAHAFCTTSPDTQFAYKVTNYYAPDHDDGIHFASSGLNIAWPYDLDEMILSDKDRALPDFSDLDSPFVYSNKASEEASS